MTEESQSIFFPLDGFIRVNADRVVQARDELAGLLERVFGCTVKTGFVDRDNRVMEISV